MHFIHHSNTREILRLLDDALTPRVDGSRGMVPLFGCSSTGKSYLTTYWSKAYWEHEKQRSPPRLIHVTIDEHRLGSLKGKGAVYSTAAACVTFSAIAEGLGDLSARYDPDSVWANCAWYREPRPLYTDRAFLSLAAFVRSELRRLRVVAIVVDNAHLIDIYSIRQLIQVRRLLNNQLALVLVGPVEKPGGTNEQILDLIGKSKAADEFGTALELQPLVEAEFKGSVLLALFEHLNAMFDRDLDGATKLRMRNVFWQVIAGDWKTIARKTRDLNRALGQDKGRVRYITREIFERVIGRLPE